MKQTLIISLLFLLAIQQLKAQGKQKFYMVWSIKCDSAIMFSVQDKMFEFANVIGNKLTESFPCISLKTQQSVKSRLDDYRKTCLLNDQSAEESNAVLASIGKDIDCDYLVFLSIKVFPDKTTTVTGKVMHQKTVRTIANQIITQNFAIIGTSSALAMADKIVDDLKDQEICPYSGPVTIEIESQLDDSETTQSPGPCLADEQATHTTTRNFNSNMKWELRKYDKHAADGNVKYDMTEKYTTVSNYPCYKCNNGDQGPTVITSIREMKAKVEGLSSESVYEGKNVSDATIKIVFLEDGTYTILVKATSQQGPMEVSEETKFEGMCENESEPKTTKIKRFDAPLKIILGPFKGTPKDKVLHQKETKDLTQGNEKTTLKIDFTLTPKN